MDALLLIVLILTVTVNGQLENTICLTQGNSNNVTEKCFIIIKTKLSWINGQEYCKENFNAGKLAEPLSEAEQNATKELVLKFFRTGWLGARRENFDSQFKREASIKTLENINDWWSISSQNKPGDCIVVNLAPPNNLLNADCNSNKPFICETEITKCNSLMLDAIFSSNNCFKYFEIRFGSKNAKSFCLENNSHLAEPTTAVMINMLSIYLRNLQEVRLGDFNAYNESTQSWAIIGEQVSSLFNGVGGVGYLSWNVSSFIKKSNDNAENETHGFVCQTAAVVQNPRHYLAILPRMPFSNFNTGYLKVTANYTFTVYVKFQVMNGESTDVKDEHIEALSPKNELKFELNSSLARFRTDSPSAFVNIYTNQPVSVTLFIMDGRAHGAESDMFLTSSWVNTSGATYILFSILPEINDANDTRGSGFNQWKEEINKKLIVDVKTTSAYRRSKESSPDTRMSAQVIGSVLGISFISSVVFVIFIGDAISLTKFCFTFLKNLIVTQNKVHNSD